MLFLVPGLGAQTKQKGPSGPIKQGPTATADLSDLGVVPLALEFGPVQSGTDVDLPLTLKNEGFVNLQLKRLLFQLGASGNSAAFSVTLNGRTYAGSTGDVTRGLNPPILLAPGQEVTATVTFAPTAEQYDAFTLRVESAQDFVEVPVSGLGGHAGDPFLHVVIDGPSYAVDYDGTGGEGVLLDGGGSHTHEPGHSLTAYTWRLDGVIVSTTTALSGLFSLGETEVELEITDDNTPPRSLTSHADIRVVPPDEVPGVLARYYDARASGAAALLDTVPPAADFVEQRPTLQVTGAGQVGGSPFTQAVMVRLVGRLTLATSGLHTFTATGGSARRLYIDGALVSAPILLIPGTYDIEARFAVESLSELPLEVRVGAGGPPQAILTSQLQHDETNVVPVIHGMTESGVIAGGSPVAIDGFGFFPAQDVVVHWGDVDLDAGDFTQLTPQHIAFPAPPGGGVIAVSISNGKGTSNVKTFLYQIDGPVPIQFHRETALTVPSPTAGVWGPDGKLYVASVDGRITVIEFDSDYQVLSQVIHPGVSGLPNRDTLGLTINPYDPPDPVKLYVSHGDHFVNGGVPPTGVSPYTGQISVLNGPDFDSPSALVTGLPISNHDHALNGLVFDNNGDLLVAVGSDTNAGVKDPDSGDLPESPLSCAVVKVLTSKQALNGAITYVETVSGLPNNDQRFGEDVDVAPGVDVEVFAAGLRNPYGLVYTTRSRLYSTDNGPNLGFGAASTGLSTQSADPYDDDELNLVEWGNYYGSPNRSRGRADARQTVYRAGLTGPPSIAETFTQMLAWLPPSSDGIDEYRADTFQGQMRGNLIVQEYLNKLRRVRMKPDGRGTLGQNTIDPNTFALGCLTAPDGAIVSLDYEDSEVEVLVVDDLTPLTLVVHDVFPWRAPSTGDTPFTLRGRGFGTLATTQVTIGGVPAELTDVSWSQIRGLVPPVQDPTTSLLDVVVTVGEDSDTLTQAFRYLLGRGMEPGRWESLASLSTPMGEVAAGSINGVLYVVGEGSSATLAYDLVNRQWLSNKATRPFAGHHHSAEVLNGKLYLVGGLSGGSEGKLQIYNPAVNSWSTGADLPWGGGSLSTAVIDGKIYAAGGIVDTFTVANCAVYDPILDQWTTRAGMPDGGRNHAAAATDGQKLYVLGGRKAGNFVTNGFDSVMVYDPLANTWSWSGSSSLAPLPEARGGMGKAVWYRGEFYVFGGETLDDPDANANGVYDRVDVYRPATNTWRTEAPMPHPRHGIFPVLFQGHIFLAGGGTHSANSQSTWFDEFTRQ